MRNLFLAAMFGLSLSACAPAAPGWLLAPIDPGRGIQSMRPMPAATGLKDFKPAGPKDWRTLNREVTP
jgi:hypothetical protein